MITEPASLRHGTDVNHSTQTSILLLLSRPPDGSKMDSIRPVGSLTLYIPEGIVRPRQGVQLAQDAAARPLPAERAPLQVPADYTGRHLQPAGYPSGRLRPGKPIRQGVKP